MSPSIARKVTAYFSDLPVKKSVPLTKRQKEIIPHIVDGKSYREIAELCFISVNTVRSHIKLIYRILEINNKPELIKKYFQGEIVL
jgi:DNA-binding CsgD family transcriptional regulator